MMILTGLLFGLRSRRTEMRITTVTVEHFWEVSVRNTWDTETLEWVSQGGGQEQISLGWFWLIKAFGLQENEVLEQIL